MKRLLLGLCFVFLLHATVFAAETVNIGDVLFRTGFDEPNVLDRWSGSRAKSVSLADAAFKISLPADGKEKFISLTQKIPVDNLRGTRLKVSSRMKAENVATPPKPYNGIKMMLVLDAPGGKQWLQRPRLWGSFDWMDVSFTVNVPEDTTEATLILGLEDTTGTVWFDDLSIAVVGKKRSRKTGTATAAPKIDSGHGLPRLRGAMISPGKFGPEDIKVLAGDWKANHVRWQLTWAGFPNGPADKATVEEFHAWIDEQCKLLDKVLPDLEKYGVRVALDLHTPPGGRLPQKEGSAMRLFQDKKFQDAFVAVWEKLATKYKDAKPIWCYDILNEPVEGTILEGHGVLNWRDLALKTSKTIRKIDSVKPIVIEPAPWGNPDSLDWFEPFDPKEVPHVVYSVHMYLPHSFTHQGVYDSPIGSEYPGKIDGKDWDKDQIRKSLRAPIEFSADYGVPIYIGEFSCIRWAPNDSAYRYLKDCIDVFEENGWDWAYHAFREGDGWSVEHGPDRNDRKPTAEPTDRQRLLRDWFEKNER